ncbi:hypothetical protein F1188_11440 [Roseospira marina]|uniref:Uncharacterized protein n=1 Tax=Roseospira marina TaxID=140057 RepID=A0A5M6IB26_9PROT|nr:hypothetical protein [Roseospira marina]KAA5605500.1 hypothetical protein F1188_11440 [Roseospira marina]MBB4314496.1 hypothetical protein [Roseospira marina]MBB5088676.1 hypothetical protein [Roseospira marina]
MDMVDRERHARAAEASDGGGARRLAGGVDVATLEQELDTFLDSLALRTGRLAESGRVLDGDEDRAPRFMDYARTRNLTSECMAFLIVIERRIEGLPDSRRAPYYDRLTEILVALWGTLLDGSLTFLRAIANEEHLPLGSREVFLREIKTLHDAHATLSEERFEGRIPGDLMSKQRQAERILNEIIDRAPRLLDLG